jgi:1-acyl-sn-glycerol-3-phosphate acyltransferase
MEPIDGPDRVAHDVWWQVGLATVGTLFRTFFRLRIEGLSNVPVRGGAIIAPNHVSVLDPIPVAMAASERGRTVRFLAAAESFDVRVVGWGLRRIRQIPVRRGGGDVAALEDAAKVVRAGALAGIFPEGRVGPGDGLQPGRRGAGRLALAAGVPVIPVGVWGTQVRWSQSGPHMALPLRPPVAIVFGDPIRVEAYADPSTGVEPLTATIMRAIDALVIRARRIAP